jgi:hypothetical protein
MRLLRCGQRGVAYWQKKPTGMKQRETVRHDSSPTLGKNPTTPVENVQSLNLSR